METLWKNEQYREYRRNYSKRNPGKAKVNFIISYGNMFKRYGLTYDGEHVCINGVPADRQTLEKHVMEVMSR